MKTLAQTRGHALGERNPKTQQYGVKGYESEDMDLERSAFWAEIRKLAQADRLPKKYAH